MFIEINVYFSVQVGTSRTSTLHKYNKVGTQNNKYTQLRDPRWPFEAEISVSHDHIVGIHERMLIHVHVTSTVKCVKHN